jgi:hypothetical protein
MNKGGAKKAAYDKAYNAKPDQVKKRVMRNAARQDALKAGIVTKGDRKDIDHKKMLDAGGTNAKTNLRAIDEKTNRGWRKTNPKAYGK